MPRPQPEANPGDLPSPTLTRHACTRMQQRGIRQDDIRLVMRYGRCIHARGIEFHVVGHKDVQRWAILGIDLTHLDGVQVLSTSEGVIVTTYRSHNLHAIRAIPRRASRFRCHGQNH